MFKEQITEKHCMLLIIIAMHTIGCRTSGRSKLKSNTKTESSTNNNKDKTNNMAYIDPHKEVEEAPPEQNTLAGKKKEAKSDNYKATPKAKKNKPTEEAPPTADQTITDPNNRSLPHDISTQTKQEHLHIDINRESPKPKENHSNDDVISTQLEDKKKSKKKKKQSTSKFLGQEDSSKSPRSRSESRSPIQRIKKFFSKNKETDGYTSE